MRVNLMSYEIRGSLRVLCRSATCGRGWIHARSQPGLCIRAAIDHAWTVFVCWRATLHSTNRTNISGTSRLWTFTRGLRATSRHLWIWLRRNPSSPSLARSRTR